MSRYQAILSDPGGSNPVTVELTGADCSWPLNDTGTWNGEVLASELRRVGLLPIERLMGRWLAYESPAGPWVGVVTAPVGDAETGTVEVVAKDPTFQLDARRASKTNEARGASAGAALRRAIDDRYRGSDPIRLDVRVDEWSEAIPLTQRADDLRDFLTGLVRTAHGEFRVDHATRTLEWRVRAGTDRAHDVVAIWGRHVVRARAAWDLEAIFNEVLAVPANEAYARTISAAVRDEASIHAHGLRQTTVVFPRLLTRAQLRPAALKTLARLTAQGGTLEMDLVNLDRIFTRLREGDAIMADLPQFGARYKVRVGVRTYSTETDTLGVVGQIEGAE